MFDRRGHGSGPRRLWLRSRNAGLVAVAITALSTVLAPPALAQAGSLDTSFGEDGFAVTSRPGSIAHTVAIQADGRIVVGGRVGSGVASDAMIVRYDGSGAPDPTFGIEGVSVFDVAGSRDSILALGIALDGSVLVGGETRMPLSNDWLVARLDASGELDATFDGDGIVSIPVLNGTEWVLEVVERPDGRVLAAGGAYPLGGTNRLALALFEDDGELDPGFGEGGVLVPDPTTGPEFVGGFALLPSGKMLFAAYTAEGATLYRLDSEGDADPSFGGGGSVSVELEGLVRDLAIGPDGSIVLVVEVEINRGEWIDFDIALVRFLPSGKPDPDFGEGGIRILDLGDQEVPRSLAIQDDSKILVVGFVDRDPDNYQPKTAAILRFDSNGELDPAFGEQGVARIVVAGETLDLEDLAIQADGKIVAVGVVSRNGAGEFLTVRLLNDELVFADGFEEGSIHWEVVDPAAAE